MIEVKKGLSVYCVERLVFGGYLQWQVICDKINSGESNKHIESNLRKITVHTEQEDYSSNGTFIDSGKRLLPNETYILKPDCKICFGDKDNTYQLG